MPNQLNLPKQNQIYKLTKILQVKSFTARKWVKEKAKHTWYEDIRNWESENYPKYFFGFKYLNMTIY